MQTEGQISIANIRTEHGDTSGSDSLSEYYRKGTNQKPVPNNAKNAAIPKSGRIALDDFYGSDGRFSTGTNVTYSGSGKNVSSNTKTMWTGAVFYLSAGFGWQFTITGNRADSYWKQMSFSGATVRPSNGIRSYSSTTNSTTWLFNNNDVTAGSFATVQSGDTTTVYIYDYTS
jgi:hypothetical protein